ncbi:hypothetical protein niasHS_017817 [Heterodera schachtii]|uniref:Transcription factor 25 n=1 Tax=Heterodera schachtii TaxID=97005 RepID=A0ABD2IHT9_HETSC
MEGNEATGRTSAEESEEEERMSSPRVNKFAVAFLDDEQNDETTEANSETENEENLTNESKQQTKAKNEGKNKNRKGTKKQKRTKAEKAKEIGTSEQMPMATKETMPPNEAAQKSNLVDDPLERLLKVDLRSLNPDDELRRLLGRTFGAEQRRRGGQQQQRRIGAAQLGGSRLTKPRWDWPPPKQIGLQMVLDDEKMMSTATSSDTLSNEAEMPLLWFRYSHNLQYQNQQQLFWMYQKQMDHEGIMNDVLAQNPFHLDSLLTLAEVLNLQEDFQKARDAIERGVFACECAFPSNFKMFSPFHRLDYGCRENRAFFLLLHRHMLNHLQRRCFQTAFQFSKLILAKDPFGDPLGILLVIDVLALKGRSPEFLLDFFSHFKQKQRLDLLPNFLFSLPLAHLALCANESNAKIKSDCEKEAGKCLEDALLRFPFVLAQLLDRLQVQPDSAVDFNSYLGSTAIYRETVGSRLLAHIYVHHTAEELWRPNLAWLERATHLALPRLMKRQKEMDEWALNRKRCFVGLPPNLLRHCVLHGIRPSDVQLRQLLDEQSGPNTVVDPCPPKDNRRQRYEPANLDDLLQLHGLNAEDSPAMDGALQGFVGTFLRTLLPDQEQARLDSLIQALRQRIGFDSGGGGGPSADNATGELGTDNEQEQRQQQNDAQNQQQRNEQNE